MNRKKIFIISGILLLLAGGGTAAVILTNNRPEQEITDSREVSITVSSSNVQNTSSTVENKKTSSTIKDTSSELLTLQDTSGASNTETKTEIPTKTVSTSSSQTATESQSEVSPVTTTAVSTSVSQTTETTTENRTTTVTTVTTTESQTTTTTERTTTSTTEATTSHQHNWKPVYKTVHHEAVGHYETVCLAEPYSYEIYEDHSLCGGCYFDYTANNVPVFSVHNIPGTDTVCTRSGTYTTADVPTGRYQEEPGIYEEQYVIDQEAYDEQVIDYYYCSCGEKKKN